MAILSTLKATITKMANSTKMVEQELRSTNRDQGWFGNPPHNQPMRGANRRNNDN
jgi:hypothetical protein